MDYIGIPFKNNGRSEEGSDCWGIVCLYYKHEMGIELPKLSGMYENTGQSALISGIIDAIKPRWTKIKDPQRGDVIVFTIAGKETHVGVCINTHQFIHAFKGTDSCMENLNSHRWKRRIAGVYRYE